MNSSICFWLLIVSFIAKIPHIKGARKLCSSDKECPKKSYCVDLDDASVCLCRHGYKMKAGKNKCVQTNSKNKPDDSASTTEPSTTTYDPLVIHHVTRLSTPFPLTSSPCPGLLKSQTSRDECNYGGVCVHDDGNQNYCSCHPLLIGATCNLEKVKSRSKETFDVANILYEKNGVYFTEAGKPERTVMGRQELKTVDECMIACHEIRSCQSIQFGPLKTDDGKTVNICQFNSATLHPDQYPAFFDESKLKPQLGFRIACCFEHQWTLRKISS